MKLKNFGVLFFIITLPLRAAELAEPVTFERALRQNKDADAPERLLIAGTEKKSKETLPTIPGLNKTLTKIYIKKYSNPSGLLWISSVLKNGAPYLAFIRKEIERRGLPPELLYLPVIESGFVSNAKSTSGAAGLWQFMRNSVRPYMTIDDWVDERLDFWKATHGALSKLEQNYKDFGDWALALAAYNSGSGAIKNVIKTTGITDYWTLCEKDKIKNESIQYVPKLLAIYYIVSNPRKFGLDILLPAEEYRWERLQLDRQINIGMLADIAGIDKAALKSANSELLLNVTPPSGYFLKLRQSDVPAVQAALKNPDVNLLKQYIYPIKSGDTLSSLARHYGVSIEQILFHNPDVRPEFLKIGDKLVIPALKDVAPYTGKSAAAKAESELPAANWTGTWVIQKGDTLWSIARANGIRPETLAAQNNIDTNDTLHPGKQLKVP